MRVVLVLPEKFRTRILGVIFSADNRQLRLSLLSTIPTPPIEALELFKEADDVIKVHSEDSLWYLIGSGCKRRCS